MWANSMTRKKEFSNILKRKSTSKFIAESNQLRAHHCTLHSSIFEWLENRRIYVPATISDELSVLKLREKILPSRE